MHLRLLIYNYIYVFAFALTCYRFLPKLLSTMISLLKALYFYNSRMNEIIKEKYMNATKKKKKKMRKGFQGLMAIFFECENDKEN